MSDIPFAQWRRDNSGTLADYQAERESDAVWVLREPATGVPVSAWTDREALAEHLRSRIARGLWGADITRFAANDATDPGTHVGENEITGECSGME